MKKLLFILVSMVALVSCSKDEVPFDGVIKDGLYVYYGKQYSIVIGTTYKDGWNAESLCYPGYITISDQSGKYLFTQTKNIETIQRDNYNGWAYENGLSIICIPKSEKEFTAKIVANTSPFSLPVEMVFTFLK